MRLPGLCLERDFSARCAPAGLEMTRSGGWDLEIGGPRVVSGGKENGRTGSEPSKSKTVREIPHPPRGVRNDKGQRLEVGGWRLEAEVRRHMLEVEGWGSTC